MVKILSGWEDIGRNSLSEGAVADVPGREVEGLDRTGVRVGEKLSSIRIILCVAILCVCWGSTFIANQFCLESFPPYMLNAVRFLIAGSLLYGWLRFRGEPAMGLKDWGWTFAVAVFLFIGGAGLLCVGQQWVASGLSATLIATVPLWTVLFASFLERLPTRREWAGLTVGFAGVALLNLDRGFHGEILGALLVLGAAATWAVGSMMNRRLSSLKGLRGAATQMIAGGVLVLILALLRGERIIFPLTRGAILGELQLIVMGGLVGFSVFVYLLAHTSPSVATSYAFINPVIAAFLGWWLAGESVSPVNIAAMVVILAGVGLVFTGRPEAQA